MIVLPPPIVIRAAAVAARDDQGIIGYHISQRSSVDGGPFHRRDQVEIEAVFVGAAVVKVRVLRHVSNGKVSSDADNAALATQLERHSAATGFAVPFDRRHFAEYAYSADAEKGTTVAFTPRKSDADHGSGWFRVDTQGHVVDMNYAPSLLPKYANAGIVTIHRAEVLPGFWATVRQQQTFTGSAGFIKGRAEVETDQSGFHRFASIATALAALAAGTF